MVATMTVTGLVSGLDVDKIVSQLMEIERIPVNHLKQRQSTLETQQGAWKDVGTRLDSLLGTLIPLKLESTFKAATVTSSDETAVTATADASAAAATHQLWVKQLAQAHRVASDQQPGEQLGLSGTFTVMVGGTVKSVSVVPTDTIGDIMAKINDTVTGAGEVVTATVVDGRLIICSKTIGSTGRMTFGDSDGVLKGLGVLKPDDGTVKMTLQEPQDAIFQVDGLEITRHENSVNDVIPGVKLELGGVTDADGDGAPDPGEMVTLKVDRNTQSAVDAVQSFVNQYNSVMDFIATKTGKTETGQPGDLSGDATLIRIQQRLRELVFGEVNVSGTKYTSAGSVGLSTGSVSSGSLTFDRSGKLAFDASKFTAALKEDPEGVYKLFASTEGLAQRLYDYVRGVTRFGSGTLPGTGDGVISSKRKMLGSAIKDIKDRIARWEDRLELKEEQLRKQFTALEKGLGALQSQSNWLAMQLGFFLPGNQRAG